MALGGQNILTVRTHLETHYNGGKSNATNVDSCMRFEETFESTSWRKAKQMQPMPLCIHSGRQFEDTYESTQWRKVKQM